MNSCDRENKKRKTQNKYVKINFVMENACLYWRWSFGHNLWMEFQQESTLPNYIENLGQFDQINFEIKESKFS